MFVVRDSRPSQICAPVQMVESLQSMTMNVHKEKNIKQCEHIKGLTSIY